MRYFYKFIALSILFVIILIFKSEIRGRVRSTFSNLETICVNDSCYKVLPENNDKYGSAEILYDVDKDVNKLVHYMNSKYTPTVLAGMSTQKCKLYSQIIRRLKKTYKSESLEETMPSKPKVDVSYNLSKGEVIALCLREYDTHKFHKKNDIMFVTLHELAHSLNCDESAFECGDESYGHTSLFWFIFKVLLENATECGIYKKHDYRASPVNYCSMPVTYSPLYDASLNDSEFFGNK